MSIEKLAPLSALALTFGTHFSCTSGVQFNSLLYITEIGGDGSETEACTSSY